MQTSLAEQKKLDKMDEKIDLLIEIKEDINNKMKMVAKLKFTPEIKNDLLENLDIKNLGLKIDDNQSPEVLKETTLKTLEKKKKELEKQIDELSKDRYLSLYKTKNKIELKEEEKLDHLKEVINIMTEEIKAYNINENQWKKVNHIAIIFSNDKISFNDPLRKHLLNHSKLIDPTLSEVNKLSTYIALIQLKAMSNNPTINKKEFEKQRKHIFKDISKEVKQNILSSKDKVSLAYLAILKIAIENIIDKEKDQKLLENFAKYLVENSIQIAKDFEKIKANDNKIKIPKNFKNKEQQNEFEIQCLLQIAHKHFYKSDNFLQKTQDTVYKIENTLQHMPIKSWMAKFNPFSQEPPTDVQKSEEINNILKNYNESLSSEIAKNKNNTEIGSKLQELDIEQLSTNSLTNSKSSTETRSTIASKSPSKSRSGSIDTRSTRAFSKSRSRSTSSL